MDMTSKKVICVPDSFKGSMSSPKACHAMARGLVKAGIKSENIILIPIADGGEGTVEVFLAATQGGEMCDIDVTDSFGEKKKGFFGWFEEKKLAVIEMAAATGLSERKDACKATSFGTGQIIKAALDKGASSIIMGIGGTSSTDCGIGAAAALGGRFLDKEGKNVPLCGEGLTNIDSIDLSGLDARLKDCFFTVLCDVTNPLYGENGAAYVYAPQKGANKEDVEFLDGGLRNFARVVQRCFNIDLSALPGGGAAGGMGAGSTLFFGAELKSGISALLDISDFEVRAKGADLILTGEGKFDFQSVWGKVFSGISQKSGDVPIGVLCGKADMEDKTVPNLAFVKEIAPKGTPLEVSIKEGERFLEDATAVAVTKYFNV